MVGTLQVFAPAASAGLVRAAEEVGRWVSGQLELAELDASRTRLMEAEVRALRAQISPHFVYNSLTAIASFVRTDPERARELLLEFADFTRYSFRRHGEFTTLAEELGRSSATWCWRRPASVTGCDVTLRVAPEVLPVVVPFLCLQPLVENAVRHGLESKAGRPHRDHRRGPRPRGGHLGRGRRGRRGPRAGTARAGRRRATRLGRPRQRRRAAALAVGDDYGLVVETAPGAGTKVIVRVPEVRPGGAPMTSLGPCSAAERDHRGLRVLVVDDERPALDELACLLGRDPRVGAVRHRATPPPRRCACCSEEQRRRGVPRHPDARPHRARAGPGARPLHGRRRRSSSSPPTTTTPSTRSSSTPSTTCSSRCARTGSPRRSAAGRCGAGAERPATRTSIAGRARRRHPVRRPQSTCATSRRTATTRGCTPPTGSHLMRIPLTTLEEQWRDAGFVRIHRSLLVVACSTSTEVRVDAGRCTVVVGDEELPVSRRHTRELRDLLVRAHEPRRT